MEVAELNNEKNWRSGLRVRVFPKLLVSIMRLLLLSSHTILHFHSYIFVHETHLLGLHFQNLAINLCV